MRAQKYLQRDDPAILATVSDDKIEENGIEDPPIVVTHLNVLIEELSALLPLLVETSVISRQR
ncbi:hypothetical protein Hanom_Chr07g00617511 [Helianthus anomalus]